MVRQHKKRVSILEVRNIGPFEMFDVRKTSKNEPLAPYNGSHPVLAKLACFFET